MKLTVGRIVHVYRVNENREGTEKRGPFAGIVVGVSKSGHGATVQVLDPINITKNHIIFVDQQEHARWPVGDGDSWLWCWPPREA